VASAAELAPWSGFFTAAAGASAVLLGLVFVAMSMHYELSRFDRHLVAMVTESAVPFFYATIVSLVMLVPPSMPWLPTGGLFVVGLLAALNSGVPLFARYFAGPEATPQPQRPPSFVIPWFVALALLPASLLLLQWPVEGLYLIGLVVVAFIAFGMQNAWDALLRRDLRVPLLRRDVRDASLRTGDQPSEPAGRSADTGGAAGRD
jgi:hypothetical protein